MKIKTRKMVVITVLVIGILLFSVNGIVAIPFSLNFGLTKERDSCNKYWPFGYAFGANIFYPIRENIMIGGRLSYRRWYRKSARYDLSCRSYSSSTPQLIELYPTIRIINPIAQGSPINILVQLGAGYGIYDIEISRSYYIHEGSLDLDQDDIAPGIYFGMGIMFMNPRGLNFEIYPEMSILHTENKFIKIYSINFGIGLSGH